jgi:hypothetical protein
MNPDATTEEKLRDELQAVRGERDQILQQLGICFKANADLRAKLAAAEAELADAGKSHEVWVAESRMLNAELRKELDFAEQRERDTWQERATLKADRLTLVDALGAAHVEAAALRSAGAELAADRSHTHDLAVLLRWPKSCKRCAALEAWERVAGEPGQAGKAEP